MEKKRAAGLDEEEEEEAVKARAVRVVTPMVDATTTRSETFISLESSNFVELEMGVDFKCGIVPAVNTYPSYPREIQEIVECVAFGGFGIINLSTQVERYSVHEEINKLLLYILRRSLQGGPRTFFF